eukprot:361026-Chlamydomonas_euryale.AAC.4
MANGQSVDPRAGRASHAQVYRPTAPGKYPGILLFSEIFQVSLASSASHASGSVSRISLTPALFRRSPDSLVTLLPAQPAPPSPSPFPAQD